MIERFAPHRIIIRLCLEIYENGCLYKTEHLLRFLVFWGLSFGLWLTDICSISLSFLVAFVVYLCIGGWKFMLLLYMTMFRDLLALYRLVRMRLFMRRCRKNNCTVGRVFQSLVKKHPNKVCLRHENRIQTFQDVEDFSNQVANCFLKLGFHSGDDVAVFMESKVEFIGIWLGLSKIGVTPALINTNLRLQSLAYSITAVKCKAVIFGSELIEAVKEVAPLVRESSETQYFSVGPLNAPDFPNKSLDALIPECSVTCPAAHEKVNVDDRLFYVYTSGTTGMPKAAIIRHSRFIWLSTGIHYMNKYDDSDVFYTSLPLYHSAGGVLSIGQTLIYGNTMAFRAKFSASKFWDDCIKYEATVAQYIGEVCRYLLAQPVKPQEKQHKVRSMFGNGLRPQIWTTFRQRFNIANIGEFYGSTEGNANIVNTCNKVGAVGFMSRIIPTIYPVTLIKVDPLTGDPIRNKKGMCIRCEPGEPGEFVGKIVSYDPIRRFDGYVNQSATKKKIVRDCFSKGDTAFLSGDVLVMDDDGFLYFVDRTGDTFRWKGENVSTMEVEGVLTNVVNHVDCVVYGVEVPNVEGRAGMAAIDDTNKIVSLEKTLEELRKVLPAYAIPQFIRLCDGIEKTGTFKLKKIDLQKQGFDPSTSGDRTFYLNKIRDRYEILNADSYRSICSGEIRL